MKLAGTPPNRHQLWWVALVLLISMAVQTHGQSQDAKSFRATLTIRADQPKRTINRNIYGQFAEHLGRGIYDGIWVGPNSNVPNTRGIRNDVVAALKRLNVPVVRWPGGCFADEYHWRDGIGPVDQRPQRLNSSWGGVIETNAFGTHEFMDFCEMIGASPYVAGNVGSGSPQEMMDWVEYMTSDSNSSLANQRRQNGRRDPWEVNYFAIGNENWGCGGNMRAPYYADVFRRYSTFVKDYSGNRVQRFASGGLENDYNWTDTLMSVAGRQLQGYSLHYYTLPTGNWDKKGSATDFGEAEWHRTFERALRMDGLIQKHSEVMDKYDPEKKIGLVVDEWGTWYDPAPRPSMGILYQQNSLRDALVAGLSLNIFHHHSDRVQMANIAQAVNVLQAMILTDQEKIVLTPTYYVFEMFKVNQDATLIPIELSTPEYKFGTESIPSLQASASRDNAGRVHLSIVNLDPNHSAELSTRISGLAPKAVSGQVLTAPSMNSINTFEKPDLVKPTRFTAYRIEGDSISLILPPKSVAVLEFR